ncbi:MAG: MoxR family ATPase [Actinobacteria bacterium]|nr:MoxR family ATPase [Acidimicrobiaceae bacterium]MBP8211492.1 MoxR family ATPase [Ilumatobacteraceae bacterium]NMD23113.1 MoxR family ATPase [Actinomycetota bacterium]HQY14899.1 MoxR family ATPase [Ilumatobacteraceae bacterium]HQY83407.1 MoxR family ATPase [Ilumatobacteraceae bacterium]
MTSTLASDRSSAPSAPPALAAAMVDSIGSVFAGRKEQIEVATACVLAGGHLLAEDIPGVGKTLLAQTLAATLGGTFARVQGTADLLPADVVGSLAPNADGFGLHFRPGPVFANVVLFDELNRANPRTQSALLEVMEEGCVTVDGTTHAVPAPFVVIATQNPVEMAGTYPLAEGVTDRFMTAISLGRASTDEEVEVLTGRRGRGQLGSVVRVATLGDLETSRCAVQRVHLADAVAMYAVAILHGTRSHQRVRLGASTRGGVALVSLAKAFSFMAGRDYVAPHDIARAALSALPHRLVMAGSERAHAADVVAECIAAVQAPRR